MTVGISNWETSLPSKRTTIFSFTIKSWEALLCILIYVCIRLDDIGKWVRGHSAPMHLGLLMKPVLCAPDIAHGSPAALLKRQMAPRFWFLISPGSKKEPRCAYLIKTMASHRQRIWTEVSSSAPHFLHCGLSINPINRFQFSSLSLGVTKVLSSSPVLVPQQSDQSYSWDPALGTPTPAPGLHTLRQSSSPPAYRPFHCLSPLHIRRHNKVPQHAGRRYHLTPPENDEPMGKLFWRLRKLSGPPDYQSKYMLLWCSMNFSLMNTGQNGQHLGLKEWGVFSKGKAEPPHRLPLYPGPVPPQPPVRANRTHL
jgi:hypothetical protein